jgi:uncharacterized membrane protein
LKRSPSWHWQRLRSSCHGASRRSLLLHHAHEYYAPPERQAEAAGGLDFPGGTDPDYWDFLYFSTGIGAASQTSDVSIHSKLMRRLVTLHSIVSFFFNTMVLALSINLASGLI